jgi:RNA polymerase sigma-70 factor (ECF subfamily)
LISDGHDLVRACLRRNRPGPYQIQAAIAAVHTDAATADQTDWAQIVLLYDQLLELAPTPIIALNRSIALAETGAVSGALSDIDRLDIDGYYLYHAARGDLLERLGRHAEAAEAYGRAMKLTDNETERSHLSHKEHHARKDAAAPTP